MDDKQTAKKSEPQDHSKKNQNIQELEKQVEELKTQAEDFKNRYLRALADYQNYERRVREEKEELVNQVQATTALHILPFLDNLEKAEVFIKDAGLSMIKNEFEKVLKEIGLEKIEVVGKEYNPHTAQAIEVIEGENDNVVAEAVTAAYQFKGRVVRPAQVKVYRKK
ncbi:nucleotide exchange factor GrpE [Candidatus Roizmanbacteria bacterium]|nr:nucleotide exchange factor GrpE [Candidatus Roizmanbacteria bacterium]